MKYAKTVRNRIDSELLLHHTLCDLGPVLKDLENSTDEVVTHEYR